MKGLFAVNIFSFLLVLAPLEVSLARPSSVNKLRFDLERQGDFLCKYEYTAGVRDPESRECFRRVKFIPNPIEVIEKIDSYLQGPLRSSAPFLHKSPREIEGLAEAAKLHGSVRLLSESAIQYARAHFRQISIFDVAIGRTKVLLPDGTVGLPFFARLDWRGWTGLQGSLNLFGYVSSQPHTMNLLDELIYQDLLRAEVWRYADQDRWLNGLSRGLHFKISHGLWANVDASTVRLLDEIVAPVLLGELFYAPQLAQAAKPHFNAP